MHICYVDECGDSGTISTGCDPNIMPGFCVCGVMIDASRIGAVTWDLMQLRQRFFPSAQTRHFLDLILHERKGAEIRRAVIKGNRRRKQQAVGFLDGVFDILERNRARIMGRIWIKKLGDEYEDRVLYSRSMQDVFRTFDHYLSGHASKGIVIADSRRKNQNVGVSHSIFTQMHRAGSTSYPHILEMPVYGHSRNHAPLQIIDLVTSAVVFPIAMHTYCPGLATKNVHVDPKQATIKGRFATRLKNLQYRYQDEEGHWRGGLVVVDYATRRNASHMFA